MGTGKTLFLCCGGRKTSGLKSRSACRQTPAGGIRKLGSAVTIGLEREVVGRGRNVTIRLIQDTMPPRSPYCGEDDPGFVAGREKIEELYGDESLRDYYVLQWTNPEHCHHTHTIIEAQGAAGDGDIARPLAVSMPGVPGGDMDADVIIPGAGDEQLVRLMDVRVVPGEYMSPVTRYASDEGIHEARGQGMTMATPCLCGGRVVSISEDDTGLPVYTVGLPGPNGRLDRLATVYASDHVPYGVGDWVFVLTFGSDCLACDLDPANDPTALVTHETSADEGGADDAPDTDTPITEDFDTPVEDFYRDGGFADADTALRDPSDRSPRTPERSSPPELSGGVIVPIMCAGRYYSQGPAFDAWEVAPSSRLIEVLNWCVRRGVIIDIDPGGRVDVEMPWGRVNALPVHYHCPGQATTSAGFQAFHADDEVLVIGSRAGESAYAVLAHGDGKPRPCNEYVVISTGVTSKGGRVWFVVYDPQRDTLASDIPAGPAGAGTVAFPCQAADLAYWLSITQSVGVVDQMDNLMEAERIGREDITTHYSDQPTPTRLSVGIECTPPTPCQYFPQVDVGGDCGHCTVADNPENPYSGDLPTDTAAYETTRVVEKREEGETSEFDYEEVTDWHETINYIQSPRGNAPRPTSLRCVWGAHEAALQVVEKYHARRQRYFSTDGDTNVLHFREDITYNLITPGGWTMEYSASSVACQRVSDDVPLTPLPGGLEGGDCSGEGVWRWTDAYTTVGGFGLRTSFTRLAVYVAISRPWHRVPFEDPGATYLDGYFAFNVEALGEFGVQNTLSPFELPAAPGLRVAIQDLLHQAFADVSWPSTYARVTSANDIHAENLFSWEVRA